ILALIVGIFVVKNKYLGTQLYLPFLKDVLFHLVIFYFLFLFFVKTLAFWKLKSQEVFPFGP
ncbi:hypothetical protein OMAG_001500, partial [Candidatus Omnitrophus magneticus]